LRYPTSQPAFEFTTGAASHPSSQLNGGQGLRGSPNLWRTAFSVQAGVLCRQLELSEFLKDLQELRLRSQALGSIRVREGQPNRIFQGVRCRPLQGQHAVFRINYARCVLIASAWAFMQCL
jgi:hypothetical protein